ncbi:mini-chromosome maintenance replisome factor-domain-containing protein [Vararia minispora EC-137]|uniref:Mini-chromosome maintenance replisome factor-domain-containing protein n=1 Tax=Vararia minispora EC-137 TaxID=1314806 RepID=A0ACB8QJA2_9AGAM|nr:mini-chromosome maintenance replisome factor-domain-containing protein [Vararia minispora EC-137]
MTSDLPESCLHSPTQSLIDLFETAQEGLSKDFPAVVAQHFSSVFKSAEAFAKIPALSTVAPPESFQDGSIVRFRAMVQDTSLSPEMYLCKFKSGKCGGWGIRDASGETDDASDIAHTDLRECSIFWAVSVPGECKWYADLHDRSGATEALRRSPSSVPQGLRLTNPHKYPIPGEPHIGAQLKIYDMPSDNVLQAGMVADFVGILHSEPWRREDEATDAEQTMAPTLHVLFFRRHDHSFTLHTTNIPFAELRNELITWIAREALGGDEDTAEWALLIAIARMQSYTSVLHPPTLTISHFPSPKNAALAPTLLHILSLLFPLVTHIPLSLDLFNKVPFVPQSKAEDLYSGILQVPSGSTILISEGGIREGKLVEQGVLNVMAVQDVMSSQSLPYKFPFSDFHFPVDFSFVILAEGSKSVFLKTDITIPLKASASTDLYKPESQITIPPPEKLDMFRYLVSSAKTGKIKFIEDEFIEERRLDKNTSPDDLKRSIMMARLSGLMLHEPDLSIDIWKRAKDLDKRRLARLHL